MHTPVNTGEGGGFVFRDAVNSRTFSRRSIHGQVAHEIGLRIVSGELAPGSSMPTEEAGSAELKVSRTAYREALKVLSAKGLVESRPKTGTRVRNRDEWNMLDPDLLSWSFAAGPTTDFARSLFEMRQIVEPAAAMLAAKRATGENLAAIGEALVRMQKNDPTSKEAIQADLAFHLGILAASGNELLVSLGYLIESALAQSFELSTRLPGARKNSIPLHEAVFVEIKARSPVAARDAMNRLLSEAWEDISSVIAACHAEAPTSRGRP
jgi:DNA-binding FadR family transcriptional regulator